MLSPVRTRWLALFGLAGMVPLAMGMVNGTLAIDVAATRAAVMLVMLALVDRLVVPLVAALIAPPQRRAVDRGAPATGGPRAETGT